jgi:molybdate transport system substrate-binding protein
MNRLVTVVMIALASLLSQTSTGSAAELKVRCAEAMKPVFSTFATEFEHKTGSKVSVSYATAGVIEKQIYEGEAFDVVILPSEAIGSLATSGKINPGTLTKIAQSPLAIAVHAGSAKPDISTVDSVKHALLAAKSIGYPDPTKGGAIGKAAADMIARLGMTDQLKAKTTLTPAGQFVDLLGEGRVELAIALPVVLMNRPGVDFVGVLPAELQDPNAFVYTAASSAGGEQASAKALIDYMVSTEAAKLIRSKGMKAAGEF